MAQRFQHQLFYASTSPYTRKVLSVAIVTGLADSIERIAAVPHPINRDAGVLPNNPLGKIPTLVTEDGRRLYDSRVIVEFIDAQSKGVKVIPAAGDERWQALTLQALADGILDAALLARYERTARPEDLQWPLWIERQFDKIVSGLDYLVTERGLLNERVDIGTISVACALGYFDLRFPDFAWRGGRDDLASWFADFSQHDFFIATAPSN